MGVYNFAFKHLKAMKMEGKVVSIKKLGKDRFDHELGSNYATFSLETNRTIGEKRGLLTATVGMFKAWTTSRG